MSTTFFDYSRIASFLCFSSLEFTKMQNFVQNKKNPSNMGPKMSYLGL